MSKQDYGWKRFWCPRSGNINLADRGYLYDPDAEGGKAYNPDLMSLEAIADVPCLVLLGEPGIGKSQELENLKVFTEKKICDSSQVLELNLRSCTNLKEDLFRDETLTDWLANSYHLYLFLDSLDEGLLSIPTLAAGLIDELKKPKYRNHINRLHLRLACRTFVFPAILEEGLKDLWTEANFAIYELAPLRRIDVIEAAKAEGFSSDDFLKEIGQKDVVPLAIKPITLRFLLNTYLRHNGQFLPEQKLHELYLEGCKLLCEEVNESRHASDRTGNFDSDQRLIVAARIAAVTIFANRFAVWIGVDQGHVPVEDILLQRLCFGCEKVNGREFEITRQVIKEVLDTGLFSSRGLHRMGWAHQTYAEFLAAWYLYLYLTQHNLDLSQILRLILHPDGRIVPQLQETTAWLASMRSDVFQKIMETDPDVLLQSDLNSTSEANKVALVETLLNLHDQEKLSYNYHSTWLYKKLQHSTLSEQLRGVICDRQRSINARNTAIDIAETCNLVDLSILLSDIACNIEELDQVRLNAAIAVCKIDNEAAKAKLKPLAMLKSRSGLEDELKGCGLRAVWPKHMTTEEVFNNLSRPQSRMIGGRYQDFVAQELGQGILEHDLPIALNWLELEQQATGHDLHYPFNALSNAIILKSWEHLDNSEILEFFSRIAFVRLKNYQAIIDDNSLKSEESFKHFLRVHDKKCRQLVESIISLCVTKGEDFSRIAYSYPGLISEQDFLWLVEKFRSAESESLQKAWAELIRAKYKKDDFDHVNTILTESEKNPIFREVFADRINAVDLDNPEVKQTRELEERINKKKYLEPSPREGVLNALTNFESGQVDAWRHLCREMTLLPTSQCYNDILSQLDITKLPGWKNADAITRSRIVKAAEIFIQNWKSESSGLDLYEIDVAAYKAFRLLLVENSDYLLAAPLDIWKQFVRIFLLIYPYTSDSRYVECHHMLMKIAYRHAHQEALDTLIVLIDRDNRQHGDVDIINSFRECWDDKSLSALSEKLVDKTLSPKSFGRLLDVLLSHGFEKTLEIAKAFITLPLPSGSQERSKAVFAAIALMLHTKDAGWTVIWQAVQQDPNFGREVLEAVSNVIKFGRRPGQNLKEKCLADLYIFLAKQYPDPDEEGVTSLNDSIRIWRDYVPQLLQERGTRDACDALRKIIHELPELKDKLQWRLLEAEAFVRRETWKPPTPEEFLQFVISQEPSNLDLSNQINVIAQRTKKMEDEPKVDKSIHITESEISGIVNTGDGSIENRIEPPNFKKKFDWKFWLSITVTVAVALISVTASGVFNDEIKKFLFNRDAPPATEQNLEKKTN
jgi:predicted NACHT family NTPase